MSLTLCALTAAAAASVPTLATAEPAAAAPQWQGCPDNLPAPLECTKLAVPLDYRDPDGAKLEVAVSRLKATNPKTRRGVLLLNPGGPGGPGLNLPLRFGELMPRSVTDSYDLIGFDPRGTGHSSPVTCELTPQQQDPGKVIPYPAPNGDITENVAFARQIAAQCAQHSGSVLPHITTANTARDMDRIRAALGEQKISYFGVSYGSYLGGVFTTLFPERSDRIILDSVVDPRNVWRSVWRHWGASTEERFEDFAKWAAQRDPSFELGSTPQAVRATYLSLASTLDTKTLDGLTGNVFRGQVRGALYGDKNFTPLAQLMQSIKRGDGAAAAEYGRAASAEVDPGQASVATLWGIVCDDASWTGSIAQHQKQVLADKKNYPITNGMPSNIWPCAFWKNKPVEPPVKITDRGPANVLLTQNLRDPATPLLGAVAMRGALGDRARLVSADQGGHGTYLFTENACVTNAATTFLVHGTLPKNDVYCGNQTAAAPESTVDTAPAKPLTPERRAELVRELQAKQLPLGG
ncbi:alpha/beta hydrolase [Amycolatopsis anabasis]|uniref:alpha/beta hydrolase n=1 Tax=Amycolatopsis anabasis TaxID=1840409 RepID=UPI00131D7DE8|nr:alpha/beta hydrolase [Amycolatopsis anabasis]